jgi:hypothetical protein
LRIILYIKIQYFQINYNKIKQFRTFPDNNFNEYDTIDTFYDEDDDYYSESLLKDCKEDLFPYNRICTPSKCKEFLLPSDKHASKAKLSSKFFSKDMETLDLDFSCTCKILKSETYDLPESKNIIEYLESNKFAPICNNKDNQTKDLSNSQTKKTSICFNEEIQNIPISLKSGSLFKVNNKGYEDINFVNGKIIDEPKVFCEFNVTMEENNDLCNSFDNSSNDFDDHTNGNELKKKNEYMNVHFKPSDTKGKKEPTYIIKLEISPRKNSNGHGSLNSDLENKQNVNEGMKHVKTRNNQYKFHLNGGDKECRQLCFEVNIGAQLQKKIDSYNLQKNNVLIDELKKSQMLKNEAKNKSTTIKEDSMSELYFESRNECNEPNNTKILNTNIYNKEEDIIKNIQDKQQYCRDTRMTIDRNKIFFLKNNDIESDCDFKKESSAFNGYPSQIEIDCDCSIVSAHQSQINAICDCNIINRLQSQIGINCTFHKVNTPQSQINVDCNFNNLNNGSNFNDISIFKKYHKKI